MAVHTQKAMVLFIYDFQVVPTQLEAFQNWAASKGMKYWERQPGVVRYQTFRRSSTKISSHPTTTLTGTSKQIDVFSEVEIQTPEYLDQIIQSSEFQDMQNELLQFVAPGSLSHSTLHRAYDSLAAA